MVTGFAANFIRWIEAAGLGGPEKRVQAASPRRSQPWSRTNGRGRYRST